MVSLTPQVILNGLLGVKGGVGFKKGVDFGLRGVYGWLMTLLPAQTSFEDFCRENGTTYWYASDFCLWLGYDDLKAFKNVLNKAIGVCTRLGVSVAENFRETDVIEDGKSRIDWKLTRFACYLLAMNGDVKKENVARAQVYFAALAEAVHVYQDQAETVERVHVRNDIANKDMALSAIAKDRDVESYPLFLNAGYRGMYNMNIAQLRELRGIPDGRSPLDFMSSREEIANLFRIKETEAKIKSDPTIYGQKKLEDAAQSVGRKIRNLMIDNDGVAPESLPVAPDIKKAQSALKATNRVFIKHDKQRRKDKKEDL